MSMRACAFFPPSLYPMLDRGTGDKHPVVTPPVPTRGPGEQAILDHEPYRQIDHAMGVMTARWCQIGEVSMKVRATLRTGVLRIGDHEIPWTPYVEIPSVVSRPLGLLVTIGRMVPPRPCLSLGGAMGRDNLWWWQVCNRGHPFGGSGSIRPRTVHGFVLLARMLGPALYAKCLSGAIPKPGIFAIVSFFDPFTQILRI